MSGIYSNLLHANAGVSLNANTEKEYKALVCIFLQGGNDSFNMLIPASKDEYSDYQNARSELALKLDDSPDSAIHLAGEPTDRRFALHPSCSELADMYNTGELAFIANVGQLVEPTGITEYLKGNAKNPLSLFSHNDQRELWQTGISDLKSATGWLGRTTDIIHSAQNDYSFSNNISLAGYNLMQTGKWSIPYSISTKGPPKSAITQLENVFKDSNPQPGKLENALHQTINSAFSRNNFFANAFEQTNLNANFPDSSLAKSLKAVATTIAARKQLGQTRQTFFVMHGGWDTHQEQVDKHSILLKDLSSSLSAFNLSITQMGLGSNVTTFTASDFGRTMRSNGRGTDHGWGGNCIVTGGAVKGGKIYGDYPETLLLGKGMDIGKNGRLLPGLSTDEYFAPLLRWLGLDHNELFQVLPNLNRFISVADPQSLRDFLK